MFSIIQSHKTQILLAQLGKDYTQKIAEGQSIFEEFVVLVPSMVLGDWLQKAVASEYGISTMITTTFWGQYQWQMMQKVLKVYNQTLKATGKQQDIVSVPEVAVLSSTVMQWRLFAYLLNQKTQILADKKHPLNAFLHDLLITEQAATPALASAETQKNIDLQNEQALWQVSSQFAKVYNLYLTHRSEWLDTWEQQNAIDIKAMISHKEWLSQQFSAPAKDSDTKNNDTKNNDTKNNNKKTNDSDQDTQKKNTQDTIKTPEWLVDNYIELEEVQRYLWQQLFAGAYKYRKQIERNFWQAIADKEIRKQSNIPDCLYLFTVQQLPISELVFLKRLSTSVDIKLFHYNPSQMFWADIVDKRWLAHQQIINPNSVYLRDYGHTLLSRLGKQSRETFASLASLSGNEYSEQFVLDWHDEFDESVLLNAKADHLTINSVTASKPDSLNNSFNYDLFDDAYQEYDDHFSEQASATSLLKRLQYDVLMLDDDSTSNKASQQVIKALQEIETEQLEQGFEQSFEQEFEQQANASLASHLIDKGIPNNRQWQLTYDDSLQIHSCYSLQRQLEVLRERIAYWLNEAPTNTYLTDAGTSKRQLSDIVVLLPDVDSNEDLIRSVFVDGVGQDGLHLPARITGVVDKSIRQLWQAICGYYRLLGASFARFEAAEVIEWLCLPTMCASLGLTYEQMARGCELLLEAGFIRGFDEAHLQASLDSTDQDYRFSFAYALDKLALGLAMPQARITDCLYPQKQQWQAGKLVEQSLPAASVTLNDAPIIDALCRVYQSLDSYRHEFSLRKRPSEWIEAIEEQIIHPLFPAYDQSREMRAIFKAMNGFRRSLKANDQPNTYYPSAANVADESLSNEQQQSNLNLRLAFVLESIEAEIGSQQVSAESTGVISFARFGSLRTVPYKLVVMLNMNLSEFPRQDKDDRYNLMQAGVARRGDRSSEDDDNGSFLDALLCASDGCWIFYNGRSLHDDNEHLPANPVSELMQFLQGEIKWQGADTEMLSNLMHTQQSSKPQLDNELISDNISGNVTGDNVLATEAVADDDLNDYLNDEPNNELVTDIEKYLPKLIENWLVTEHPALPFAQQLFTYVEDDINDVDDDLAANVDVDKHSLKRILNERLEQNKLAEKSRRPPVPLWSNVYQQLQAKNNLTDAPFNQFNQSIQSTQFVRLTNRTNNNVVNLLTVAQYEAIAQILSATSTLNTNDDDIAQAMYDKDKRITTALKLIQDNLPTHMDIMQLASQVYNPAKTFLRQQHVYLSHELEENSRQEPLKLDNLANYQITEQLLSALTKQFRVNPAPLEELKQLEKLEQPKKIDQSNANKAQNLEHLLYGKLIPAGVARQSTLSDKQHKLEQQLAEFVNVLKEQDKYAHFSLINSLSETNCTGIISECHEVSQILTLNLFGRLHKVQLKANIPVNSLSQSSQAADSSKQWLNIVPYSNRPKHLLKFWLAHIFWQIVRNTSEQQALAGDGDSVWYFNKAAKDNFKLLEGCKDVYLPAITAEQATAELSKWLMYAQLCGQLPLVLMMDYALPYLEKYYKHLEEESSKPVQAQPKDFDNKALLNYQPKMGDYSGWTTVAYGFDTIFDSCSKHQLWQYVLGDSGEGNKAFYRLKPALQYLAQPLFSVMYDQLATGMSKKTCYET